MADPVKQAIRGYELRDRIGLGDFSVVYRAYQPGGGREVALKIIRPEYANQVGFIRRFETEAQIIARLDHRYIVPLYDYWREPSGAYLVMRLMRGGSLRDRLQHGPLDPQAALQLVEQIASALEYAHRNRVIHRDIKPANILLDEAHDTFLSDFEITRFASNIATHYGGNGSDSSLKYLSPEQCSGERATQQSDIYALGLVLYEVLTGDHAYGHRPPSDGSYLPLDSRGLADLLRRSGLPEALEAVILKATAQRPEERYAEAPQLAAAFREAIAARSGDTALPEVEKLPLLSEALTDRELEVLQWIAQGFSNREIANQLVLSPTTIKWYVHQILRKLGVERRREALAVAQRLGLLASDITVPDGALVRALPVGINPYKGLRAFQQADAHDFFGREALTEHLLQQLGAAGRFLAVVGPSGSGKSSVVRAGMIPALRRGELPGAEQWLIAEFLPGSHPFEELELALLRVAVTQTSDLAEQLQRDERGLLRAVRLVLADDTSELLLLIDQFEELFTLVSDPQVTRRFLDQLYTAVSDPHGRLRVIITLRADFYDRPLMIPCFSELMRTHTEAIIPLTPAGLERAIVQPSQSAGVMVEPGLVAALIAEVNEQPGTLPLLQYALTELFERRNGRTMTLATYQRLGGALGILTRQADEVFDDLNDTDQALVKQAFLRLVTLGDGGDDLRRRVLRSELNALSGEPDIVNRLFDTLGSYRLLTFDRDPATRAPTIEIAHEALIQRWHRLRGWLDESRADIRQQRWLMAAAADWKQAGQEHSYLLSGSRLTQFEGWAAASSVALAPDERTFLDASLAERRLQRARRRRLSNAFLLAVVVVAVVMTVLAFIAFDRERQAQAARADARGTAAEAQELALVNAARAALAGDDADSALALAVAANRIPNSPPEAQLVLSDAAYRPGTIHLFQGHTEPVQDVAFSPDGRFALSGSTDKTAILWDVDPASPTFGSILHRFQQNYDVFTVAFSPDGRTAMTTSGFGLYLWNVAPASPNFGALIHVFEGHSEGITTIVFSRDGHHVFSGSWDQTVVMWDVDPTSATFGTVLDRFEGQTDGNYRIIFSPDGRTDLSIAPGGQAVVQWDVDPNSPTFGTALHRFEGEGAVNAVAFSPDGRTALVGGDALILWDMQTDAIVRRFRIQKTVYTLDFSPDGRTALTDADDAIALWDVESGTQITRLIGHTDGIPSAVFSPGGRYVLSGSADDTLRLWDVQNGAKLRTVASPQTPAGAVDIADLSPDGRAILAYYPAVDHEVSQPAAILLDAASGTELHGFGGYGYVQYWGVAAARFARDGHTALISGVNGEMMLWDMQTGERLFTFPAGHSASWLAANGTFTAFSPDERSVLSVAKDCQAILWDADVHSTVFGQPIRHFISRPGECQANSAPVFSRDGRTALVGTREGPILEWDVETGQVIRRLIGHTGLVWDVALSPDGRTALSTASDNNLILWDLETGQEIRRFVGQKDYALSVAFSPDGRTAFSDVTGGGVTQWDVTTGQPIRRYPDAGNGVFPSPDGRSFFSAPGERSIAQWRVDTLDELLTWTLAYRYVRELTCDERRLYQLEPLCDAEGSYPTRTPYATTPPTAAATASPTTDLARTTATAIPTITLTLSLLPTPSAAHLGANRGFVAVGDTQVWTYAGRAGEVLTLRVNADHPANWDTRVEAEPTPEGGWFDSRVSVTAPNGTILLTGYSYPCLNDIQGGVNTDSLVEGLTLPEDGTYFILVSGWQFQTGGAYTLTLETPAPGASTPECSP